MVRAWMGFVALGAGLIHVALVIGSTPQVGIPLLVVGAAELAWGVIAFSRPALPLPRVARIAAVVPILAWVVALVLSGSGTLAAGGIGGLRVLPMLLASLLDLAIAIGVTGMLRWSAAPGDSARFDRPLRPGRYLLGLAAGALVVVALTTPALAATEAGEGLSPSDLNQPGHGH